VSLASQPLPEAASSDAVGSIPPDVYVLPEVSPLKLFTHLAESEGLPEADDALRSWRHTVIVGPVRRAVPSVRTGAAPLKKNQGQCLTRIFKFVMDSAEMNGMALRGQEIINHRKEIC